MITFSCFVPHPPIIIPDIGKGELNKVNDTLSALKKLADDLVSSEPDIILIISPHGLLDTNIFTLGFANKMFGDLSNFGSKYSLELMGDIELAQDIVTKAGESELRAEIIDHQNNSYYLDHGILVPLYYLMEKLDYKPRVLPIGYSGASRAAHFSFGQAISDAIKNSDKRVAIVASGDLSHNLITERNSGGESGKIFDATIVENIKNYNPSAILTIDENLQEEAGECGYRSLLILLGILDGEKVKTELLSYEAPWGVGYMVAKLDV
jgi:aromatic ring-opening dioxygenase LigB subunit